MIDSFHDLETWSAVPLKDGSFKYAESAEVMLWAYAVEDGTVHVWDRVNGFVYHEDELSGLWVEQHIGTPFPPQSLQETITDPEQLVWFQNGGMFDFVVLREDMPDTLALIDKTRWRDTMVQAFSHSLPGSLDKLGEVLNIGEDKRKIAAGKKLVRLFCMPQNEDFVKKWGTDRASKKTHPKDWLEFIKYAAGDIHTMREAHRLMPSWNYKGKQVDLWHTDLAINYRGFEVDLELAQAAVEMADLVRTRLSAEVHEATDGEVNSATQRDAFMDFLQPLLAEFGVDLPDMRADTLERRLEDPDLPDFIKELMKIRLQASMNSVSKFKTLLKSVNSDGRLRGTMQFRGAGRTGRWAHRRFQPGNLPRATLSHELIQFAIRCIKARDLDSMDLVFASIMAAISNTIRGAIVAAKGKKLVVADLANIEGRVAAWVAGEEWKLQAFRDYDTILMDDEGKPQRDEKGKVKRKGLDLYIKAYMASFNILDATLVGKDERQIGKVEELMFQYGGGVGAWLTGAATYGIDLNAMTEAVWDTLPEWAKSEAEDFLLYLYEEADARYRKACEKALKDKPENVNEVLGEALAKRDAARLKKRYGLTPRVFVACDAIKRLWRKAHPRIVSFWKSSNDEDPGLEDTVRRAINQPNIVFTCRKVKIKRAGNWLRIGLPSGRVLCYPNPGIDSKGIFYTGHNPYSRAWGKVYTYGGKLCIARGTSALTQRRGWIPIEEVTSVDRVWDGSSWVSTGGAVFNGYKPVVEAYGAWMTHDHEVLTTEGWKHASQSARHHRADCRLPDGVEVPRQRRSAVSVVGEVRCLQGQDHATRQRVEEASGSGYPSLMRLHATGDDRHAQHEARDVYTSGLRGVEGDAGSVLTANPPRMERLWGAWHHGLQTVGSFIQRFLDRYGASLQARAHDRAQEQRQGVQPNELRVGHLQKAGEQQAQHRLREEPVGQTYDGAVGREDRDQLLDLAVSVGSRSTRQSASGRTRRYAAVFDLMDCGPQHRFTILAGGRPLIVHNCENIVQAIACDQLAECTPLAEEQGYPIVLSVHDELVTETPDEDEYSAEELARIMCSDLVWNRGLPLAAAGFSDYRYRKAD